MDYVRTSRKTIPLDKKLSSGKIYLSCDCLTLYLASWSSSRHFALASAGLGFKSWLFQVEVGSLGKSLYMPFPTPLMGKQVPGYRQYARVMRHL